MWKYVVSSLRWGGGGSGAVETAAAPATDVSLPPPPAAPAPEIDGDAADPDAAAWSSDARRDMAVLSRRYGLAFRRTEAQQQQARAKQPATPQLNATEAPTAAAASSSENSSSSSSSQDEGDNKPTPPTEMPPENPCALCHWRPASLFTVEVDPVVVASPTGESESTAGALHGRLCTDCFTVAFRALAIPVLASGQRAQCGGSHGAGATPPPRGALAAAAAASAKTGTPSVGGSTSVQGAPASQTPQPQDQEVQAEQQQQRGSWWPGWGWKSLWGQQKQPQAAEGADSANQPVVGGLNSDSLTATASAPRTLCSSAGAPSAALSLSPPQHVDYLERMITHMTAASAATVSGAKDAKPSLPSLWSAATRRRGTNACCNCAFECGPRDRQCPACGYDTPLTLSCLSCQVSMAGAPKLCVVANKPHQAWACEMCSMVNTLDTPACVMCASSRSWQCPRCHTVQAARRLRRAVVQRSAAATINGNTLRGGLGGTTALLGGTMSGTMALGATARMMEATWGALDATVMSGSGATTTRDSEAETDEKCCGRCGYRFCSMSASELQQLGAQNIDIVRQSEAQEHNRARGEWLLERRINTAWCAEEEASTSATISTTDAPGTSLTNAAAAEEEEEAPPLALRRVVEAGDGNCMFRALARSLLGTPDAHLLIRRVVVEGLRARAATLTPFFCGDEEFTRYVQDMGRAGTWGDEMALRVAAAIFGVDIFVVTSHETGWFLRLTALADADDAAEFTAGSSKATPTDPQLAKADLPTASTAAGTAEGQGARLKVFLAYTAPVHYDSLLLMVPEAPAASADTNNDLRAAPPVSQRLSAPRSSALLEELRARMAALRDDAASWCYV